MSKYTRKQKSSGNTDDEFVSFWTRALQKTVPYFRAIGLILISFIVVSLGVFFFSNWREGKVQAATEELGHALRIYEAELLGADEKPPEKPADASEDWVPRFKTDKERLEGALAALDKVEKNHPVTPATRFFRAGLQYDLGKWDEAAAGYNKLAGELKDGILRTLSLEGAGLCAEAQNKLDDALARYKDMEPKPGSADFYRDRALFNQGRVYLKKGEKKKAVEVFKEAVTKVPTSSLKDEIQTQLLALE